MWRRSQGPAVKARPVDKKSNTPSVVTATKIQAAKGVKVRVGRDIGIARINRRPVVNLGVHNNIRLVVSRAREEVCPLFTHVVSKAEIGVAIAGVNFEAAKSMNQPDVNHAIDGITAVNGGSAIL